MEQTNLILQSKSLIGYCNTNFAETAKHAESLVNSLEPAV
jgi:hypothetical protein